MTPVVSPAVSVVIPTQRRPAPLALALNSALAQTGFAPDQVEVVIVDNDAVPSARAAVEAAAATAPFRVVYAHEPRPGVAHARNTGLAHASAPLIAFLDDDEEAPPHWLRALVDAQARYQADAVFGPVRARVPDHVKRHRDYLARFFSRPGPAESGVIPGYFGCGDSLVVRASLPDPDQPFDPARNHIGGEDDLLFGRMQALGARFAWAADAWVWEDPAPSRLTLAYTLKRAFAYGQGPTAHCASASPPDRLGVVRWMAIGVGQAAVFGALGLVKWAVRAPDRAETWDRAVRGLGKTFWGGPANIRFYGLSS